MKNLEGKVALIIGASSGIGEGAAEILAEKNLKAIYIAARREDKLIALAGRLRDKYKTVVVPIVTDATQPNQLDHLFQTTLHEQGRIDYIVNAVGLIQRNGESLENMSDERIKSITDTNLTSAMLIGRRVATIFKKQSSGIYMIIASEAGIKFYDNYEVYCATKAGENHFARSLNETFSLLRPKIEAYVFALCPGLVDTPEARLSFPDASEEIWAHAPDGKDFAKKHILPYLENPEKQLAEKGVVVHIPTVNY